MRRFMPSLLPFVGLLVLAAIFLQLDQTLGYHSPLRADEPAWTPRQKALQQLEEWRRKKAEEAARRAELLRNLTTRKMVGLGREIVHGKGLCLNCHRIGNEGEGHQGPNLAEVGKRAGSRIPGMSDLEYLTQSLYEPEAFVVPGFSPTMPPVNQPPIALDDEEIRWVVAYLQSLGGTPTLRPDQPLPRKQRRTTLHPAPHRESERSANSLDSQGTPDGTLPEQVAQLASLVPPAWSRFHDPQQPAGKE